MGKCERIMKVFRIEHKESRVGVFGAPTNTREAYNKHAGITDDNGVYHHTMGEPPGPYDDGKQLSNLFTRKSRGVTAQYYFGFQNKNQLKKWFSSESGRQALMDHKMVVGIYKADGRKIKKGEWQVAFKKAEAIHLKDVDLVTLNKKV